ncbi:MAG: YkuS family protein [Clostridia bacterium]|nr:YkuS family protein [Clostridia bacterium]
MGKRVAVEGNLSSLKKYLSEKGFEVVNLDPLSKSGLELKNCDAVVISGMDTNLLGHEDIMTKAPVIDASGRSEAEILTQLQNRLS